MTGIKEKSIPGKLKEKILGLFGADGARWLDAIPDKLLKLEDRWKIKVGRPFDELTFNYIAPCARTDGSEAVVRIGYPVGEGLVMNQARMLSYYQGRSAPALFEYEEDLNAILIERVKPGEDLKSLFSRDHKDAVETGISVLGKLPRALPVDAGFPDIRNWYSVLDTATAAALPETVVSRARSLLEELLARHDTQYLLHGDFHHGNILSSENGEFVAIDPEGALGPIGYEIAVFLNEHLRWIRGRTDRAHDFEYAVERFSREFDIGRTALRGWSFCQMVMSACWDVEDFGSYDRSSLRLAEM